MDTGCSNWKPIPPSRPNMCCFATTSASQLTRPLQAKIANYLRRVQGAHGGWPLVHDGDFDMSASVKAYFALKMIGDSGGCAAYGEGARGDPVARRRHPQQRLYPRSCWRCSGC